MTKAANKNSQNFHTKISTSRNTRNQQKSRRIFTVAKRSILTVIVLAMLVVVLALLLMFFLKPERLVKSKIEAMSADYYENYFYPNVTKDNSASLEEIMKRYEIPGFAMVSLRQLLLYDNEKNADAAKTLTTYCDENTTYIQIFPEAPYGKTNYHINYHYSCTF